jgi:hypothetical protein
MFLTLTLYSCIKQSDSASTQNTTSNQNDNNTLRPTENNPADPPTINPNQGEPRDSTDDANWWGTYKNEEKGEFLDIANYNGESFRFKIYDQFSSPIDGVAAVWPDDDFNAGYMDITFSLFEDSNVINITIEGDEWAYFSGIYERTDETPWDGPGDPEDNPTNSHSDVGDTDGLEWWGIYGSSDTGIVFEISQVSNGGFWVDILRLTNARDIDHIGGNTSLSDISDRLDCEIVTYGWAEIDRDNAFFAVLGNIGLSLYEDYSAIDLFTVESTEWEYMRGQYVRIS